MTNILFLDLDGPVFSDRQIKYHSDNWGYKYPGNHTYREDLNYWRMDDIFVEVWKKLVERPFEVVISSSWTKYYADSEMYIDLFKVNNLELPLHKDWCTIKVKNEYYRQCNRAIEISNWLNCHSDINSYVILDDELSGFSLVNTDIDWDPKLGLKENQIILVDYDVGLSSDNIKKLHRLVKDW